MNRWTPGLLSNAGIFLVLCDIALYFACLAFACGWHIPLPIGRDSRRLVRRQRTAWGMIAVILLLIAAERQLQLLDLITATLRVQALDEGNYGMRRFEQAGALKWVGLGAIVAAAILALSAARAGWRAAIAMLLVVAMVAMLMVKAVSLHNLDALFGQHFGAIQQGNLIDLGLVACIGVVVVLEGAARLFGIARR